MSQVLTSTSSISSTSGAARQARRNHRWIVLMALTPVVFIILYAVSAYSPHHGDPVVAPLRVPPRYTAITDAYFGYSIPSAWKQDSAFSDANGDFYYDGPGGWAGEHVSIQRSSPTPATPVPEALRSFDVAVPSPLIPVGGHRIRVPGTTFAYQVLLTRPDGFRAEAIDTWEAHSQTEMWLMVNASAGTDTTVLATLQGSAVN